MKNVKAHFKSKGKWGVEFTLEDLKKQWDKQGGICPYTGWELLNLQTTNRKNITDNEKRQPHQASLDRIDSFKGYTVDNIQFISYMANCAKNCFTEDQFLDFCFAVTENRRCFIPNFQLLS